MSVRAQTPDEAASVRAAPMSCAKAASGERGAVAEPAECERGQDQKGAEAPHRSNRRAHLTDLNAP